MKSQTIQNYLKDNAIPYELIYHPRAVTAEQIAHVTRIPEEKLAKTVVIRINGQITLVVLHANERVNLHRLGEQLHTSDIKLCPESEFVEYFPDCEPGAMPPLGELYHMPVIVSEDVAGDEKVVFNAGTHTELISMKYEDFARAVRPQVGHFASH